ncbi:ATP-dependent RNA helicase DDX1 [Strongyloides ratti]|uniref:ATP-dependent RNA helicase n=1 Tax=Strongyloides ratti TaxID=34506 RepID=A0A090MZ31_STRRB|nr:ATP-dependent RNA helicase DDX1 [Strongyloides ratti]CEF68224.1 ATP-dependent RNA helicase DDX1 [Strongyloides ratti]
MAAFEDLGIIPELAEAVTNKGWSIPSDIQCEGIPAILGGGDVLMAAETGSGKTGAFCLPILQIVYETLSEELNPKIEKKNDAEEDICRMNSYDKSASMEIQSNGTKLFSNNEKIWSGCRSYCGVKQKGKYFYEVYCETGTLFRFGWGIKSANLNLGHDKGGFGYGATAMKSNNKVFDEFGEKFKAGDYIGCYLNLDGKEIRFSKNGNVFPPAFKIPSNFGNEAFYPIIALKQSGCIVNLGKTRFKYPPTSDYKSLYSCPEKFLERSPHKGDNLKLKRDNKSPLCIVIEPSKELAYQTYEQLIQFSKYLKSPTIKNVIISGGIKEKEQDNATKNGLDIVTCTLGKFIGMIEMGKINLSFVKFFVLDEADSLVSGTNNQMATIKKLYGKMVEGNGGVGRLQMIVCSATLHNPMIDRIANEMMSFPQWVDLKGHDSVPDTVHHVVVMVNPIEDQSWIRLRSPKGFPNILTDGVHRKNDIRPGSTDKETLSEGIKILKMEYCAIAIEKLQMEQCIIFCRTKLDCDNLEKFLKSKNPSFTCAVLHSDRSPEERNANLLKFKEKAARLLICTDVAARGIDVSGLPYVINLTLPSVDDKANYVHRIGRVGRSEVMGLAISFVGTKEEKVWYHGCPSRGKNCNNRELTSRGGCTIWFDEMNSLREIEEHLGETISQITTDFEIPKNTFDGKVVYGAKQTGSYTCQFSHAIELTGICQKLFELERNVQLNYLNLFCNTPTTVVEK